MGKEQLGNSKLVLRFEPLIVQKCNCAICGKKLRWKITIFQKDYFYYPFGNPFLKKCKSIKTVISPVYFCEKCNYMIERDNQKKIRLIQQEVGSFVLKNAKELINIHKID